VEGEMGALVEFVPKLQSILDSQEDRRAAAESIPATQALWAIVQEADDASFVGKSALIYDLYATMVDVLGERPRPKWTQTPLAGDENLPMSKTWEEYCLTHLGMHFSTASGYRRIWEVFRVRMGYSLEEMLRAGKSKLSTAVGEVAREYPQVDERLVGVLFGDEHACVHCEQYVAFENGEPPEDCPHCGQEFEGTEPGTLANTMATIQQLKNERQPALPPAEFKIGFDIEVNYEGSEIESLTVLPQCALGEMVSFLPPWEIVTIDDDAPPGEFGVRRSQADRFYAWLRHKLPEVWA
jgi:hypothetical protein